MVATKPPLQEVAQNSSFPTQGDRFTPRQQEIIGQLQALAGNPPRVITTRDVGKASKEKRCSSDRTVKVHFERFSNALRAANLPIGRTVGQKQWNADDTPEQLRSLARTKDGRILTGDDVDEANRQGKCPSKDTLERQSGSFNDALRAAGLPISRPRQSRRRAVRQLRALTMRLKRTPTSRDVSRASTMRQCPSVKTLRNYFGSFNNALRAARLPARERELAQYLSLKNELGHVPTIAEVNSAAQEGICPTYETLSRLGVLKQVREERDLARGDTCADCGREKSIAMFLNGGSQWVCHRCYRKKTGKSQPKYGICQSCRKGPQLISYRHPVTRRNICQSCYRQIAWRQPTALRG